MKYLMLLYCVFIFLQPTCVHAQATTSPNMGLTVPVSGTTPCPDWADYLNNSLNIIDQHNHSSGQGVQIQPNGLDISSDLTFQENSATDLKQTLFTPQAAVLTAPTET